MIDSWDLFVTGWPSVWAGTSGFEWHRQAGKVILEEETRRPSLFMFHFMNGGGGASSRLWTKEETETKPTQETLEHLTPQLPMAAYGEFISHNAAGGRVSFECFQTFADTE